MSETKFTPGPWRVEFDSDGMETEIKSGEGTIIADGGFSNPEDPDYALIAAAPEMYAMLDGIDFDDGMISNALGEDFQDSLIALLAKARGEA